MSAERVREKREVAGRGEGVLFVYLPSPFHSIFSISTNVPSVLPTALRCPRNCPGSSQAGPTLPHNHLASCQTNRADPVGVASGSRGTKEDKHLLASTIN